MRKHRTQNGSAFISVIFILSIILSSCATATPVIPGEVPDLEPEPQRQVEIPGGLMVLPDGSSVEHPVLVFDFQIQSRLVTTGEYQECVEAGGCEPGPEVIHEYAPAGVSWNQAQTYCSYLGGRLPTEAELTRATGGGEDCPETGGGLVSLEGFGEWVYDWDDPDYYNHSLITNPFGPMYGDLKVAMGLNLNAINEVIWKYFGEYDDAESFAKYDEVSVPGKGKYREVSGKVEEDDGSFSKEDDGRTFIKLEDLRIFTKEDWQVTVKLENGKFFIGTGDGEFYKVEGSDLDNFYPRMGILPDQVNPLVGFRCVTQGAALTYAPICKTQTAANCSLPSELMAAFSEPLTVEGSLNPNFNVIGYNCPQGDKVAVTISHELPSGENVEVKADKGNCNCQEFAEYPGNLYCSCPSPGAGYQLNLKVCQSNPEILVSMDDFCPPGSQFDLLAGGCSRVDSGTPLLYSLTDGADESGASTCPSGPGLPVPNYGSLGLALSSVEGVGEGELPEGEQWDLFSLSDGSGMCPPGYAFSDETGCCSPFSEENYDCGPQEYFDAGTKQCLPVGWDGCAPCQELSVDGLCVPVKGEQFISERCNTDSSDVDFDEYGRPPESSEGCADGSYLDPIIGRCLQTRDGCALGTYLDPKTGTCRPISGPESPCDDGYIYSSTTSCCVPAPGNEGSEYPEGATTIDMAFPDIVSFADSGGCASSNFYDPESNSCLLRVGGDCPPGTLVNLVGLCIPEVPGACPDGTEYEPLSGSCPTNPPDPAVCVGDKVFDASLGFCVPGLFGRDGGRVDLEDLAEVPTCDEDTPELALSCSDGSHRLMPITSTFPTTEGILKCLILSADKTYMSGRGFCQKDPAGKGASEDFFTIDIEEGKVASITRISPDVIEPAEANAPPLECANFVFGEKYFPDSDDAEREDDWSESVSGTLPPVGACTPNLFIDAGALYDPQTCTPLQITVPICAAPPTSGGGSNPSGGSSGPCAGLGVNECGSTAGCIWDGTQCVKDTPVNCTGLKENICNTTGGCHWDNVNSTCVPD